MRERHGRPDESLFASIRGGKLSRYAVERLMEKYISIAAEKCQSLKRKNVSPHALRHYAGFRTIPGEGSMCGRKARQC
jgi:integrase/recombinase XerD